MQITNGFGLLALECYLKTVRVLSSLKELKNKAVLNLKQCCLCCYVVLSSCFKIVSTVAILVLQTRLI